MKPASIARVWGFRGAAYFGYAVFLMPVLLLI